MSRIRKALVTTAIAGSIVGLGASSASAANEQALFDCNGVIDVACTYRNSWGGSSFCTLWFNGGCVIG